MSTQQTQNPALPIGYKNPWSAEHWNVTEQGRAIQNYGLTGAQGLAAAAGSFIGATAPASKPKAKPDASGTGYSVQSLAAVMRNLRTRKARQATQARAQMVNDLRRNYGRQG